jgi:hypothetical protein
MEALTLARIIVVSNRICSLEHDRREGCSSRCDRTRIVRGH